MHIHIGNVIKHGIEECKHGVGSLSSANFGHRYHVGGLILIAFFMKVHTYRVGKCVTASQQR